MKGPNPRRNDFGNRFRSGYAFRPRARKRNTTLSSGEPGLQRLPLEDGTTRERFSLVFPGGKRIIGVDRPTLSSSSERQSKILRGSYISNHLDHSLLVSIARIVTLTFG